MYCECPWLLSAPLDAASNRRVPGGGAPSSLWCMYDSYQGTPSGMPEVLTGECAFRRWIWAFEFHHGAARPARLTQTIPASIRFDFRGIFVLLCVYTGKEVVG